MIYDFGLHLYALGALFTKKTAHRLGRGFPDVEKHGKPLVWIHAVSLGETKAIAPLIAKFKERATILLTTATKTGFEEGARSGADYHAYLPFDFSYLIRPIVKRVKPDLVVLTETDFWYHFEDAAKKVGAKLVVVNGKVSERSFKRFLKFPYFSKKLLQPIDHFYLQGELYRERFEKLGIPASKLTVTGNLKLDGMEIDKTLEEIDSVLTLGSTHDPEEKIWIEALKHLWTRFPELKVMIVPRHPERFETVAKLLETEGVDYGRFSSNATLQSHRVLLVDAMGILHTCYRQSTFAFVGGSLIPKVGGHNVLEPCFYGKPVLFGPHMDAQPDLLDLVKRYDAGRQIEAHQIEESVEKLLTDGSLRRQLGRNGLKLVRDSRGALEKTYQALLPLLEK